MSSYMGQCDRCGAYVEAATLNLLAQCGHCSPLAAVEHQEVSDMSFRALRAVEALDRCSQDKSPEKQ